MAIDLNKVKLIAGRDGLEVVPVSGQKLTSDDREYRRRKVAEAKEIRKANPKRKWADIADDVEVACGMLQDWHHNPLYQ